MHITPKDAAVHMLHGPEATLNLIVVSAVVCLPQT